MKNLVYKVLSDEFGRLKREFSNKREAIQFARWQRKAGWTATVVDMRTGKIVLGGAK